MYFLKNRWTCYIPRSCASGLVYLIIKPDCHQGHTVQTRWPRRPKTTGPFCTGAAGAAAQVKQPCVSSSVDRRKESRPAGRRCDPGLLPHKVPTASAQPYAGSWSQHAPRLGDPETLPPAPRSCASGGVSLDCSPDPRISQTPSALHWGMKDAGHTALSLPETLATRRRTRKVAAPRPQL